MEFLLPDERPPMDIFVPMERTRFATVRSAFAVILDRIEMALSGHPDFTIGRMLLVTAQYAGMVRVHVLDPEPLHHIDMNWMK